MSAKLLDGIRFADFCWAGAGSFSTKFFADLGADVIKIESVTRADPVRLGGPFKDGKPGLNRSGYFASRNTGKRSVALNLKEASGREIAWDLIRQADVVSNNFGPGAMERLGFGADDVHKVKPDAIYLAMPMYGESGPLSGLLGVGMTISAVTGFTTLTGYPDDTPPIGPGTHYPDHAPNPYHAAFAVLSALRHRRRTGRGLKIDLAQVESTLNCMSLPVAEQSVTGHEPTRVGNRSVDHAPHGIFPCQGDDRWCAITVLSDPQWQALARIVGRDDLAGLKTADRLARVEIIEQAVEAWTGLHDPGEVMAMLQAAGIPAGIVADARDLMEQDPQLRHRNYWQHLGHPEIGETCYTSPPYILDGERVSLTRPPLVGEHTDEVLATLLGYTPDRIATLRAAGVLESI